MPFIQSQAVAYSFSKAAPTYDAHAFLQRKIGQRLLERLSYIRVQPRRLCDLGTGTGFFAQKLLELYPQSSVTGIDLAPGMITYAQKTRPATIQFLCHDAQALPLTKESFDLIFSNGMLQWCTDIRQVLRECHRLLSPSGLLLFSTFGPDTLKEIRACWQSIDTQPHTLSFADMHDYGDALLALDFQDPVMDCEHLTISYPNPRQLLSDLKKLGAHNLHEQRARGLQGKTRFQNFLKQYEAYKTLEGFFPATYEIIYGLAWKSRDASKKGSCEDLSPEKI